MRQDLTRKNASKRRVTSHNKKNRFQQMIVVLFIFFAVIAIGFYHYHTKTVSLYSPLTRWHAWLIEHKKLLQQNAIAAKKISTEKSDEPKIHFEFYTTLPNMQMHAPLVNANTINSTVKTDKLVSETKTSDKPLPVTNMFLNPEELEKEFAKEIAEKNYMIQVGSFKNANAAEHLRQALLNDGFQTMPIKLSVALNGMYRVQMGPFTNKNQAKLALKELQKKGKYGILYHVNN